MKDKERKKIFDVSVNRVDGVSVPATGRTFLLMKSAGSDTTANSTPSQRLISASTSVIDSFSEGNTPLTKEQAESVQSLAHAVGVDLHMAEASSDDDDDDDEEDEDDKKAAAKDDSKDDEKEEHKKSAEPVNADDMEAMLRKMIGPMLHEEIRKLAEDNSGESGNDDEDMKKSDDNGDPERVTSNQIKGQDSFAKNKGEVELGEGLFEDVIFK